MNLEKYQKISKKPLDKGKEIWYNKGAPEMD